MRTIRNIITAVIIGVVIWCIISFTSCTPQKRLTRLLKNNPELLKTFNKDTIIRDTILIRDTINLPADSGKFSAYVDSLNNTLQTIFNDSLLTIQAQVDSLNKRKINYSYKIKERLIPYEKKVYYEKKITVPCNCPELIPHTYSWWELVPWWLGMISIVSFGLYLWRKFSTV